MLFFSFQITESLRQSFPTQFLRCLIFTKYTTNKPTHNDNSKSNYIRNYLELNRTKNRTRLKITRPLMRKKRKDSATNAR